MSSEGKVWNDFFPEKRVCLCGQRTTALSGQPAVNLHAPQEDRPCGVSSLADFRAAGNRARNGLGL